MCQMHASIGMKLASLLFIWNVLGEVNENQLKYDANNIFWNNSYGNSCESLVEIITRNGLRNIR